MDGIFSLVVELMKAKEETEKIIFESYDAFTENYISRILKK